MKNILPILFCLPMLVGSHVTAQESSVRHLIDNLNSQRAQAFAVKDLSRLISLYDKEAVCMPEFHPPLLSENAIQDYFSSWIRALSSSSYSCQTTELVQQNNDLYETGTFTDTLVNRSNDTFVYAGKYLRHWRMGTDNCPKIYAEIWGGSSYCQRTMLPYTGGPDPISITLSHIGSDEEQLVIERNRLLSRLVRERRGSEHASLFTDDAVYMPYYMPPLTGMKDIHDYFVEHEKPGDVTIDSLTLVTGRVTVSGNLIMEHGFYGVRWTSADKTSGVVTGKSLNLWKRQPDGTLMMFRQMVNHN